MFFGQILQAGTLVCLSIHSTLEYIGKYCKEWLIPLFPNKLHDLLLCEPHLYDPLLLLFLPFVFEVSLLSHIDTFPVNN